MSKIWWWICLGLQKLWWWCSIRYFGSRFWFTRFDDFSSHGSRWKGKRPAYEFSKQPTHIFRQLKPKQLTVLLLVITANIKREIKLRPIQLHPSSPGHGKLPRTAPDFHGIFSGLEHRGKLDGNADLQAFAQTVERVSYPWTHLLLP